MFCPDCKLYRDEKDFILNQTSCYKCIYEKKTKLEKTLKKLKKCKICNTLLHDVKKFSYCSEDCAEIGKYKVRRLQWGL